MEFSKGFEAMRRLAVQVIEQAVATAKEKDDG